jgi:DNA invertase Pin-like site-specific DNA recombinase
VGYIRVSTGTGEQLAALESQRARIEAAGVERIIQDVQSGRESDRAGYMELLDLIDRRQVSEVVITRIDRLGRDAADTDAAIAFAAKRGVTLTAIDGGTIESETPQGFAMSRFMTTMAEMESRMLSMRIKSNLEQLRLKGRPIRGRAPWGYRLKEDKSGYEPDPREWPRAQKMLRILSECKWRLSGALRRWAAEGESDIPLHSPKTLRGWLKNPVLRGGLGYFSTRNQEFARVVWNTHQPLMTSECYSRAEQALKDNRRMWGQNVTIKPKLLTGLCRCGSCGRHLSYAGGRTIPALLCRHFGCPQQYKSTHESVIREAVLGAIRDRAESLATLIAVEPPEAQLLRDSIERLEALNDPDLDEAITAKRLKLQNLHNREPVDPQVLAALRRPMTLSQLGSEELRQLFLQLVQQVEVADQAVSRIQLHI